MNYKHSALAVLILLLSSCNDFLDIKPYGKTIPRTREDYKALIDNLLDGIDKGGTTTGCLVGEYSTTSDFEECADNLETNITQYPDGNLLTIYIGKRLNGKQSVYTNLYENIRNVNIVLGGYDNLTQRADSNLIGTCYAIRGVAYYQLLRQFCAPAMTADATLGVPLVTEFDLEAKPIRSTWDETFQQAESDLKRALSFHIDDKMYRFNDDVMTAYLARLYHWAGRWTQAYDCAMQVVSSHPLLDSLAYRQMQQEMYVLGGNRLIMGNRLSESATGISSVSTTLKARPISTRWLNLFPEGSRDVRYAMAVGKYRRNTKVIFSGIRSAEMYLIAMESKAHLGQTTEAMAMLRTLRQLRCPQRPNLSLQRIPTDEYIQQDATGQDLTILMYNILKERRKELYLENGDRFFELKRNGRPEFWVTAKDKKYWTRKYMYTFPIYTGDLYVQPGLIQNPGYEELE